MATNNMTNSSRRAVPKSHRVMLYIAATLLTFLLLWFWSFLLRDIGSVMMPDWQKIEEKLVDPDLKKQQEELEKQKEAVSAEINDLEQNQRLLRDSTNSTRDTMNQLLENQKRLAEKNIPLSAPEQDAIAQSQQLFLENQNEYQQLNQDLVQKTAERRQLDLKVQELEDLLRPKREQADKEYTELLERAQMKSAAIQLAILLPLFLFAFWLLINKRKTTYGILVYPFAISLFLKMMGVVHEYFPSRYFKYIALLGLIAAVVALMMYLLKMISRPRPDLVLKQTREAYEKQQCPECAYPIRRGWLKWIGRQGKHSPRIIALPAGEEHREPGPYCCPSCGERLYEECGNCHNVRHSQLPFCDHCGVAGAAGTAESGPQPI